MMARIIQSVTANGLPTTGKSRELESSFNNRGLDEQERTVEKIKRLVWPQYLVEPQYIEGYFGERWTA
jgi:hypothetical protein